MIQTRYTSILLTSLLIFILGSCKISKGFETLETYNYFEAKRNFEKSLKKNESPAAYGLSVIYFRDDNPFHNLDSAYHYGLLSVETFCDAKEKKQLKWHEKLDFTLEKALKQRTKISDLAFNYAVEENSVTSYQYFISNHPWSNYKENAESRRDSLAFLNAQKKNNSFAYEEYLQKYPTSAWRHKAKSLLFRAQYDETVIDGKTQSYMDFIELYPNNPLVRDAHFQIYSIETNENSIAEYSGFIRRFPDNYFVDDAWTNLYRLSIADYKKETIEKFAREYPDFPFKELITQDLLLVGKQLYQFIKDEKYGFMDEDGSIVIPPIYEYAGQFKNGLAVVIKGGKYGYINKNGKQLIDYKYEEAMDFDQGRAIVSENDKYGLIDVSGAYILQPEFLDIGVFSEGLAYVQNDAGYQYYNLDGSIAFTNIYDEAFSFQNGIALVRKGDKKGYIKSDGAFLVSTTTGELSHFKDSIFVHELRDEVSLMYSNGTYLFETGFDKIGALVNNRAIIEKDGSYGYINGKGEIVIPIGIKPYPNYMQFAQFENGHVVLNRGNKFAMMDSVGKQVLPALFSGIGTYGELIPVTKGQGWGYSNNDVRLIIDYQYDYAYGFVNGGAIVERDGLMGMINLKDETIIPIEYELLKRLTNNLLLVKRDNFFGLLAITNDVLVAPEYDRIQELSPNLYQLIKGHNIAYFDLTKNLLIRLKE